MVKVYLSVRQCYHFEFHNNPALYFYVPVHMIKATYWSQIPNCNLSLKMYIYSFFHLKYVDVLLHYIYWG